MFIVPLTLLCEDCDGHCSFSEAYVMRTAFFNLCQTKNNRNKMETYKVKSQVNKKGSYSVGPVSKSRPWSLHVH
jgi:hypothetical protein